MKYIKVIQEFTFPNDLKLIKFEKDSYLIKADDRNGRDEYLANNNSTLTSAVVRENMDYFCEVSESEFYRANIDLTEMESLIKKMCDKHDMIPADLIKKVCEELNIPVLHFTVDWNQTVPTQPINPFPWPPCNPVIQPYVGGSCPQCLQPNGTPCWSTNCPNKNIIYCSTNLNENK